MNKETVEALLSQACQDGVIEIECPVCQAIIITESDSQELYCQNCQQVTGNNPLTELGLI